MPIQLLLCLFKLGYFVWLQAQLADRFVPGAIVSDMLQSESALPSGARICSACFGLKLSAVWADASRRNTTCMDCGVQIVYVRKKQGEWVQTPQDYVCTHVRRSEYSLISLEVQRQRKRDQKRQADLHRLISASAVWRNQSAILFHWLNGASTI